MSKQKKSIIANFGALTSAAPETKSQTKSEARPDMPDMPAPLPRVGAGVIGAAQRSLGELRDERDRLKALIESGAGGVIDVDTVLIDPSPFPDRLADDGDGDYALLRQSFSEEGQKVPVQLRPHPETAGRYQVIFGHRRVRVARELDRPVKAVIVDMSDRDLVVSQGIENAARQDLTWIERALFARRMDDAGIRARDIRAALAIDDPELARMRAVHRALPLELIEAIGRAPKIGRPRWVDFARAYAGAPDAADKVSAAMAGSETEGSDARFQRALASLKQPAGQPSAEKTPTAPQELRAPNGATLGLVTAGEKEWRLQAKSRDGVRFAAYLQSRMAGLVEDFMREGD